MKNNWIIEDNHLDTDNLLKNESIFHVANGYIGVRGNFEEGYNSSISSIRGTYINAFYDEVPITYGEKSYAFPETMQKLVNIIDVQTIKLQIGNEIFNLFDGEIKHFRRFVDLKEGVYTREIHWISPNGHELKITIKRVASFTTLELLAIEYTIEKIHCDEAISIYSTINGNVENYTNSADPRVGGSHAKLLHVVNSSATDSYGQIICETKYSKLQVAATTTHILSAPCTMKKEVTDGEIAYTYTFDNAISKVTLTKYTIFTDTIRHNDVINSGINLLKGVINTSFETICSQQKDYLDNFWQTADIELEGDDSLQQGIRFNVYQLLQSVGKDKHSNIAAKGLSGEGYEGHYFWDTEIYMLPFFILCNPALAKQLLTYRYTILDHARKRALELGHKKGAAYAWRTITGDECSAYFPAGTAQYHINGDIAYTYIQYYLATGDYHFVEEFGAEVIFETARIWLEIGHFHKGAFKINAVTGPDEYTAIVNNNYYTNRLAQYNLLWAVKWYTLLKESSPEVWTNLINKIQLTEAEICLFEKAAKTMYLPYDETLGISEQDDSFLSKAVWDFEHTPKENYPLLLHYHPLTIYRYQVLKQADVVLSHFLLEDDVCDEIIRNSYDYYEQLTTHDSSLSCAIYSIMAAKVGYTQKAYDYFIETARLDLDNTHNNTKDGLHTANMGGTWMSIVYGFAGVRIKKDLISFNPQLPDHWTKLSFNLSYQGTIIHVCMTPLSTQFRIKEGQLNIRVYDTNYLLAENMPLELPTPRAPKKPEAFIFDLDGVLTDTAHYHYLAWKQLADTLGYTFTPTINERLKGVSRIRSFEIILEENNALHQYTPKEIENLANKKNALYVELIKQITEKDILPGIMPLLTEAKASGIKLAVASASKNAFSVLDRLGISHFFDYIADANFIEHAKPHPEVFLTCAQALDVNPTKCIGFEDAEAGIEAIHAAGMMSVGIHVVSDKITPMISLNSTEDLNFSTLLKEYLKTSSFMA